MSDTGVTEDMTGDQGIGPGDSQAPARARHGAGGWEREIVEKIALEGIGEQRRRRRWGIFF
ncbi:MAG: hypothetical protein JSW68_00295, partial [Burkholderiales bacterium]